MHSLAEVMEPLARITVFVFTVSTLFGGGLAVGKAAFLDALKSARRIVHTLVASFVIIPLLAIGISVLFRLSEPMATGMLIIGVTAGAPIIPKLAALARSDIVVAVAMMVVLTAVTTLYAPFMLTMLLPDVALNPWDIARTQLLSLLLPLFTGMAVRHYFSRATPILIRLASAISSLSLLLMVVLVVSLTHESLRQAVGSGAFAAAGIFVVLAFLVGYFMGGRSRDEKVSLGIVAAQRNLASALLIAGLYFEDHRVVVMVLIASLMMVILGVIGCRVMGRRSIREAAG